MQAVNRSGSGSGWVWPWWRCLRSAVSPWVAVLVSPELAGVLATAITRLRREHGGRIPLIARYDRHARSTGPEVPTCSSVDMVRQLRSDQLPHRPVAPDAGPGRALRPRWRAFFQDDLIRSYWAFLDNRRAARLKAEYRIHRRRVTRVPRAFLAPKARTRRKRPSLRHAVQARTRLLNRNNLAAGHDATQGMSMTESYTGILESRGGRACRTRAALHWRRTDGRMSGWRPGSPRSADKRECASAGDVLGSSAWRVLLSILRRPDREIASRFSRPRSQLPAPFLRCMSRRCVGSLT